MTTEPPELRSTLYPFETESPGETIAAGFADFGLDDRLTSVDSVFIKPNLVSDDPIYIENGSNTDVRVIKAVIEYLEGYDLDVLLGESETGTKSKGRRLERALEHMGIYDLQAEHEFEIVNLTEDDWVTVPIPDGTHLEELDLAETFLQSDLIVNLPKVKTHKYATITCSLKNMFGVVPDPLRIVYHEDIHRVLRDLNSLFHDRTFTVVDGIRGMEGNGPLYGTPVDLECLGFADHPVAADMLACLLMEIDPREVTHLSLFREYTGTDDRSLEVGGPLAVEDVARPFAHADKNWYVQFEGKLMQYRPVVKFFFDDRVRRNFTYYLDPLLSRLRGGSYSWYIDDDG